MNLTWSLPHGMLLMSHADDVRRWSKMEKERMMGQNIMTRSFDANESSTSIDFFAPVNDKFKFNH